MRKFSLLFLIGLIVAGVSSIAAPRKSAQGKPKAPKAKKAAKSDLQTDVRFDDSVLHGQYQMPEEALAKVENEKGLEDLLGVRKHFKDRLLESAGQE